MATAKGGEFFEKGHCAYVSEEKLSSDGAALSNDTSCFQQGQMEMSHSTLPTIEKQSAARGAGKVGAHPASAKKLCARP